MRVASRHVVHEYLKPQVDLEFVNLGFGNGKGEPELAELAAQISAPACLVIDYEANCGGPKLIGRPCRSISRLTEVSSRGSYHPGIPHPSWSRVVYAGVSRRTACAEKFQMELIRELTEAGDHNLTFVDGSDWLGDDPGKRPLMGFIRRTLASS